MNCIYNLIPSFLHLLRAEILLCHTYKILCNEMDPIRFSSCFGSFTITTILVLCVCAHQNAFDVSMAFGSTSIKIANVLWKYSITHIHSIMCSMCLCSNAAHNFFPPSSCWCCCCLWCGCCCCYSSCLTVKCKGH